MIEETKLLLSYFCQIILDLFLLKGRHDHLSSQSLSVNITLDLKAHDCDH